MAQYPLPVKRTVLRRLVKEGSVNNVEKSLRTRAGNRIPVLLSGAVMRDDGKLRGIVCLALDITKRKRVEELLRQSEEQFRAMFEVAAIGIAQADPQTGRWLRVNQRMCAITGYSAAELLQMRVPEITHPEDRQKDWEAFQQVVQGAAPDYHMEKRYVRKDGSITWVNVNMTVIRDAAGQPARTMATIEDITERKRAEEALRESENKFRSYVERAPVAVLTSDLEGRFLDCNPAATTMLGYDVATLSGMSVFDIHPEEDRAVVRQALEGLARCGRAEGEFRMRRRDGTITWGLLNVTSIGSGHALGYCQDITKRKCAEEQLLAANARLEQAVVQAEGLVVRAEAANRAKSEFLANMSHEIRTPMTAILGFSDLLASPNLPYQEQREFLAGIQRNGKALLELISDILDLSRIEADRLTLERADCPLQQIIDDVLSVVQVRAEQKGLALEVDYAFPLPETIHTDPVRLRQVLTNLIGNAVKFTDRGAVRITVRCTREADGHGQMQFAISDTGIGIPADKIDELFKPFTQVDGSATRRYGGTGLGLAISRRLAKALGGDVEVASQVGKGSTFTLTIDAGSLKGVRMLQSPQVPSIAEEESSSTEHEVPLHGRVLLAEDVPDIYVVLRQILQRMNLEVEIAEDGRLACEMAEKSQAEGKPFDLILMDIQMPKMNGYEATRWLRQHGWKGPIVALTAHALVGDREKCLEAGCNDYIAKPITAKGLRDVLARYLGQAAAAAACPRDTPETAHESAGLLQSGILDPSKVAALMDAFRGELPARAERIDQAFQQGDRTLLFELVHQLKGSAGLYGFDNIAETARTICDRLRADDELKELQASVSELVVLCRQAASHQPGNLSDQ